MAAEDKDKKTNGLLVFLVLIVLVSIGVNVYLFQRYGEQDDGTYVMASWQEDLSSVKAILADLDARQSTQETVTQDVLNLLEGQTLTASSAEMQDGFSGIAEALALMQPDGIDQESWNTANIQIQEALSFIRVMVHELDERQSTQGATLDKLMNVLESQPWEELSQQLTLIETRQVEQIAETLPDWVDKESWEAANLQIQDELSSIKDLLNQFLAEQSAAVPTMASAREITYIEESEIVENYPVVEVRLRPGDSVWGIVARFHTYPSPTLVNKIVDFNNIEDPKRLPVGFPVRVPLDIVNGI